MGAVTLPEPVKLFAGLILSDAIEYDQVLGVLAENFGVIDLKNKIIPFTHTDYYQKEMGERLWRTYIAFKSCVNPEELAPIKLVCNELEHQLADKREKKRRVNIDPGYLTLSKIVLATTKDRSHRIYLNKGIYAEITLSYSKKEGWQSLPWTYPDYKAECALTFFNHLRLIYYNQKKLSLFFAPVNPSAHHNTDLIEHN